MAEAMIFDAIRTPRGRGRQDGSLHEVKPVALLAGLMQALQERHQLDTAHVDDVVIGCVQPWGEQASCIGKTAALAAGWNWQVAGVQLDRYCGSGLDAINLGAQKLRSGWEDLIVAGGVESMSRTPMGSMLGSKDDTQTVLGLGLVPQGIGADLIATLDGFSREDVDQFALQSQIKATHARSAGYFKKSLAPVRDMNGIVILEEDEFIKPNTTMEGLGKLKPAFLLPGEAMYDAVAQLAYPQVSQIHHVHTAGNSSGIVDGAALVLLGTEEKGRALGLTPRARIVSAAVIGAEPIIMLAAPAPAARKALAKAGLRAEDIDLFEVNEAFSAVVLRFIKEMNIDPAKVNVNGGAIAMGHPLGATGAILLGTMLDELERRNLKRGLISLCVAGGMGVATIVERI